MRFERHRLALALGLLLAGSGQPAVGAPQLAPLVSRASLAACARTLAAARAEAPQGSDLRADKVQGLVARGRQFLEGGQTERALDLFVEAHTLGGEGFQTHVWILRAWLDQGRINDALNQIDRWLDEGRESADIDYLIGMAFHARGKDHVLNGIPDQTTTMSFQDALRFLTKATLADPARYHDAFGALAESAWYTQQVEVAQTAAQRAVELAPSDSKVRYLLAQVLFSRFVIAEQESAGSPEANSFWIQARQSFERTRELIQPPKNDEQATRLARAGIQLGFAHLWRQEEAAATDAIGQALGWDANQDYPTLRDSLSPSAFRAALEQGARLFEQHFGADTKQDVLLLWWLGFARYTQGLGGVSEEEGSPPTPPDPSAMAACEQAFQKVIAKEPEFVNSWYYLGLARYYRGDYQGLLDAFHAAWDKEPANLVGMLSTERELNLRILDYVLGWCHETRNEVEPAFLCELRVGFYPESWEYWDNLGLFARNAGAALSERAAAEGAEEGAQQDLTEAQRLWERSLEAYQKARELAPDHPHLLNDAAVVLHYYLKRDLEGVRTMYEQARDEARGLIEAGGLNELDLDWARRALADSQANLRVLDGLEEPDLSR